ncbi:YqaJ viral recombinase family protein [Burkholderia pseudomallei]|uniref:YqaJ viral recombinase family protein n=1 Tax=Burkholderia pseudomallei TaxID=28450 RepID=UPI002AB3BED2|nr:YqaJ viral recombinase family protein [Burkholderia pseudomallei]MDY7760127.1 YqaJ viral recombinase family protein [Burkholderia pseudomallei]
MTERIVHNLVQGTPEWEEFRLHHFGASEAAAMLGLSTKVKRNELLHMKHTGTPKEFSDWVQEHILDHGHEVEALARPLVEEIIGEELYPTTCSVGILSASCDGLTMSDSVAFEHKQWNESLAGAVRAGILPDEHKPQCQQILLVTGAIELIFVVSDGTSDNFEYMWVQPDLEYFDRIRAGWAQFEKDLAAYEPRDIREAPKAEAIMSLPTLAVQIRGEVVASNLPGFKAAAEKFIASIKTDLQTDEDFANAAATVTFCEKAEKELEVAKNAAIGQTASIDELMRTLDHIRTQLRDKRLALDKLVTKRKTEIKDEIIADGRQAYADHVAALNAELGGVTIAIAAPDFVTAAKNKRTLASLHEAIDTAVANGKIAADAAARELRAKLDWYRAHAAEHVFLFRELQQLIQKPADDFQLAVNARIDEHKRQEAAKEEQRKADEAAAAQRAAAQAAAAKETPAAAAPANDAAPPATAPRAAEPLPGAARAVAQRRIPRPTAAQVIEILADHYGATPAQTAALLVTLDFQAELSRLEAAA